MDIVLGENIVDRRWHSNVNVNVKGNLLLVARIFKI